MFCCFCHTKLSAVSSLTSWSSTKSNPYFSNSLVNNFSDTDLYRIFTFKDASLLSIFRFYLLYKILQIPSLLLDISQLVLRLYREEFLAPRQVQAGGSSYVGCPLLLIRHIRSYFAYLHTATTEPAYHANYHGGIA